MDFFRLDDLLTDEERLIRNSVRVFVQNEVMPIITKSFETAEFPISLIKGLKKLRILGMSLPQDFGGLDANAVVYGLVCQELEAGDSGLRSFVSVQNSLCIFPIFHFGSLEQKKHFLPKMVEGEIIGCFGLTEPDSGSDPGSMKTHAKKVAGGFKLVGSKAWITNAPIADLAIVWAKTDEGIKGFIVEKGAKGFFTSTTKDKLSMRASSTGELFFDDCFVPDERVLPKALGLASPLKCLSEARYGIAWGAMGAALDCYQRALSYAKNRNQFNKPIASFQLIQKDLVHMLELIVKGQLLNIHLGRLKDSGKLEYPHISLAKMSNSRDALSIARLARNILGANGISLDYHVIRHMANLETVFTYEGTDNIHNLIVGKHITGLSAFG